jgi:hypothetical protein
MAAEPLDEPDLKLVGLRLWVHGREFPDSSDYWDGNWLSITARVEASGALVEIGGPLIRNTEIQAFARELGALSAKLSGVAELKCVEPGLHVSLSAYDGLGHIGIAVSITPDQLNQFHKFEFGFDQTYLPALIAGCEAILARFPIVGSP